MGGALLQMTPLVVSGSTTTKYEAISRPIRPMLILYGWEEFQRFRFSVIKPALSPLGDQVGRVEEI